LSEADQAQIEQLARDLIDLPTDGDALHLHAERGDDAGRQIACEVPVAEECEFAVVYG
jgi:hypothetical protein